MDLKLKNKKVLVLGSTSGLGSAMASQLINEGADVVISGRDKQRSQDAVLKLGAKCAIIGDLTEVGQAKQIVDNAAEALGGLNIIIINTGGGSPGQLIDLGADTRDRAYETMLRPALEAAMASVPHLKKIKDSRMIFITARSIVEATPELALSSVFRSGVAAAARSLALELAPDILVNVVIPGQFDTPAYGRFAKWSAKENNQTIEQARAQDCESNPLGRIGKAEELADVVAFLSSPRSSFVNGSVIRVDGGAVKGF